MQRGKPEVSRRDLDFDSSGMGPLSPQQREQAIKAFRLIDPKTNGRHQCAAEIAFAIKSVEWTRRFETSPAQERDSLKEAAKGLRKAASVFSSV